MKKKIVVWTLFIFVVLLGVLLGGFSVWYWLLGGSGHCTDVDDCKLGQGCWEGKCKEAKKQCTQDQNCKGGVCICSSYTRCTNTNKDVKVCKDIPRCIQGANCTDDDCICDPDKNLGCDIAGVCRPYCTDDLDCTTGTCLCPVKADKTKTTCDAKSKRCLDDCSSDWDCKSGQICEPKGGVCVIDPAKKDDK